MTTGRKPDPNRAKRQTGNRPKQGQKVTKVAALPKPVDVRAALLEPPADLAEGAAEIYRIAAREIEARGLKDSDLIAIRMLAETVDRYRLVSAEIRRVGVVIASPRGAVVNPLLRVERELVSTYLRLAETLGLTPAARVRLGLMTLAGESILGSLTRDLDSPTITVTV